MYSKNGLISGGGGGGERKISSFSPSYKVGLVSGTIKGGHGEKNLFILHHPNQPFSGSLVTNSQ